MWVSYLSTKFELIGLLIGDLSSEQESLETQTHTQTEFDTLSIQEIVSSKNCECEAQNARNRCDRV